VEITSSIIVDEKWYDSVAAREKAEAWQPEVLVRLQKTLGSLRELGRPVRITFNSSSDYMIQGACFVEPGDSTEVAEQKIRRAQLPKLCNFVAETHVCSI
jgi:hypothetical protein